MAEVANPFKVIKKVEYFTRNTQEGDSAVWDPCDGNGCQVEKMQFQADTATLCGQFKFLRGHSEHRDLMVKVTLGEDGTK